MCLLLLPGLLPNEFSVLNLKNKSHTVTAQIQVGDQPANGAVVSQGGSFAGGVLYARGGIPKYCYNLLGVTPYTITADEPMTAGIHELRMEFTYDGGGRYGAPVTAGQP